MIHGTFAKTVQTGQLSTMLNSQLNQLLVNFATNAKIKNQSIPVKNRVYLIITAKCGLVTS